MEKGEVRTMLLPVKLTEAEVRAKAKELTRLIAQHRNSEIRLEDLAAGYKSAKAHAEAESDDLLSQVRSCSTVVSTESEMREVEVFDVLDFDTATVLTKRGDTEEVVASRGMTEAERQRSLFTAVEGGEAEASEA